MNNIEKNKKLKLHIEQLKHDLKLIDDSNGLTVNELSMIVENILDYLIFISGE